MQTQNELQTEVIHLRQQVHLLRTIVDHLPALVYAKDTESKFLVANAKLARQIGLNSSDELIGKDDFDFFPQEIAAKYYADEQVLLERGEAFYDLEEVVTNAEGQLEWIATTKVPVRDEFGQIVAFVGIGRDITERKRSEEAQRQQQEVIEAQRQALQELSTPIIPIMDRIIVMPLIGAIDTARARDITRSLLAGISQFRAHVVILDITGVPVVDSGVADHLNRTIQAARLKGAHTIITGISDAVAETVVDLGIDWSGIETLRDLQAGLLTALERVGFRIENRSSV